MKNGNLSLFGEANPPPALPEGVFHTPKAASPALQEKLLRAVAEIVRAAPLRTLATPGGGRTSAAMTNAGDAGWWSDRGGYRYAARQPDTGAPWPPMPAVFRKVVALALEGKPWPDFAPDACLIAFYGPGARMGLHQDRDERDLAQPIVTVSLGDDADFLVGGFARGDRPAALRVASGDVVVMGGAGRLRFHGVRRVHPGTGPLPGLAGRYSLTFRKAL